MKTRSIRFALVLAVLLAAGAAAAEPAPGAFAAPSAGRKTFDFDLSAFYRAAAAQGAPLVVLNPDGAARDMFVVGEVPNAFTTPELVRPGASFGHILDLPKPSP